MITRMSNAFYRMARKERNNYNIIPLLKHSDGYLINYTVTYNIPINRRVKFPIVSEPWKHSSILISNELVKFTIVRLDCVVASDVGIPVTENC